MPEHGIYEPIEALWGHDPPERQDGHDAQGAVSGLPSPSATVKESMDFFDGVSQASLQRETFPVAVTYVTRVNRL